MTGAAAERGRFQWIEYVLAGLILVCGVAFTFRAFNLGYLPPPFFYDPDDTFRDWFSTAIWAHDSGAYDSWLSIYPPLSFAMLKVMGVPACYTFAPLSTVRDCDWLGVVLIHAFYVLNGVIASIAFMKIDRRTALPRAFAFTAGMPMLFGLERGNIILICITCVMLGWGPLIRSARLRWIFVGMAVNFKVYLIAMVLVQLVRRRWLWFEGAILGTIVVYLVSYMVYGQGTPVEIVANIINFSQGFYSNEATFLAIWYYCSLTTLHTILVDSAAPVAMLLGENAVNQMTIAVVIVLRAGQLLTIGALVAAWLRPEVVSPHRVLVLGLGFLTVTQENAPYALPIWFFFIFMERWKGWFVPTAIALTYLEGIAGDIRFGGSMWFNQFSYLSDRFVLIELSLGIGMFLRPLGLVLIASLFSIDTIVAVVRDVRQDGWASRWRFRRDAPLLPRVRLPVAVSDRPAIAGPSVP